MIAQPVAGHSSVDGIWRYPVKSMGGEELVLGKVTPRGIFGDRVYALVDKASNRAATVRTWGATLLNYRSRLLTEMESPIPPVRITMPDGSEISTMEPTVDGLLSAALGRSLTVMSIAPAGLLVEFPAGTLGGALSNVTEVPLAGAAPSGTFFDYACVHLIASSTLNQLQTAYPQGRFEIRRFRPNLLIRTNGEPYVENSWTGRRLAIGDEVVLRVSIPCPRCVNTILPQADLPLDPGILRTIAQENTRDLGDFGKLPCAGVYADVVQGGNVRRGDAVRFLD